MKKHFLFCLFAAMTLGGVVTSCSDDDNENEIVVCPIETTTFNSTNGLELTYSGEALLGKQVVFTPNVNDPSKATLEISGAAMSGSESLPISVPAVGVIPGEAVTKLDVDLHINGDVVSFEGESTEEGRTIKYEGSASKSFLKLNLNVQMPSNPLQGKKIQLLVEDKPKDAIAPMHIVWNVVAPDWTGQVVEQDVTFMLKLALGQVKVNGLTLSQCLTGVLKDVSFLPDGNIQASYKDAPTDADFIASPLNLAYYTSSKEGEIRLFLNVPQIIYEASKPKSKAGEAASGADLLPYLAEVMPKLIGMFPQLLTEGIVLNYELDEKGTMFIYLDKEVVLPILKLFNPVLQNEEFLNKLGAVVDSAMPGFGNTVKALAKGLPTWLENTSVMKLGIDFVEVK